MKVLQYLPPHHGKYETATWLLLQLLQSSDKYVFDSVPLWCWGYVQHLDSGYVQHQSSQVPAVIGALGHICCATYICSLYAEKSECLVFLSWHDWKQNSQIPLFWRRKRGQESSDKGISFHFNKISRPALFYWPSMTIQVEQCGDNLIHFHF